VNAAVDRIASAVLYEGYLLYPYRPSAVKNRQRFNFGVLYPRACAEPSGERWFLESELLVEGPPEGLVEARLRFLRISERQAERPAGENGGPLRFEPADQVTVDGRAYRSWQEAVECDVSLGGRTLGSLAAEPAREHRSLPAEEERELLRDHEGRVEGALRRVQQPLQVTLTASALGLGPGLCRLRLRAENTTARPFPCSARATMLEGSLVSAHVVATAAGARFVSLLEPPAELQAAAQGCTQAGNWPVLVGDRERRDTVLCSPIILYDFPEIARESAGDLFDSTEIDEILSLRVLTLSEEEKREVRESDERARALLERTESLSAADWSAMHGVLRRLCAPGEEER